MRLTLAAEIGFSVWTPTFNEIRLFCLERYGGGFAGKRQFKEMPAIYECSKTAGDGFLGDMQNLITLIKFLLKNGRSRVVLGWDESPVIAASEYRLDS